MGTAKNEFFRLPRKTANAHFIRGFGDAEKFFCTYLTQSDDLGRIVIPKEIRRTLRIKEGDPLEIFTDREGEVILKKYSQVGELGKFAAEFAESLAQTSGHGVCITDRDQIVAAAGGMKKEYIGKTISDVLENMINERESILAGKTPERHVELTNGESKQDVQQVITPILCGGDAIG